MPRFSIGQLVHYTGAIDGSVGVDTFYRMYSPDRRPFEVLAYADKHLVHISLPRGTTNSYGHVSEYNLAPAGPPTTTREMSNKILREAGYATV